MPSKFSNIRLKWLNIIYSRNKFDKVSNYEKSSTSLRKIFLKSLYQHPPRLVFFSFLTVIIIGTILLSLPAAVEGTEPLSIIDALFTSTSATCVTGLIVVDTGTQFSTFGELVILLQIQVGGLGIMTLSTFFIFLISGRLSFTNKEVLVDTLSQSPYAELNRLLKVVFLFTIVIELAGAIILTLGFLNDFSLPEAAYLGVFHSISAFCNAGFSLFSNSFMDYQSDVIINITVMILIILGGLGFIVIMDIYNNRLFFLGKKKSQFSFHSKIVVRTTGYLLLTGFVLYFLLEYSNGLKGLSIEGKIFTSIFQSVTTRTAGFNTVAIENLTTVTLFIFILLMFIGASPGSCGGGIKTTTFAIILHSIFHRFRMREDVNILKRRIPQSTVSRIISIVFFSVLIVVVFTILLLILELPQLPHTEKEGLFIDILFEVVSAFGTVGLSTGITSELSNAGKILITILMFIGRLGPLTIALAVNAKRKAPKYKYVQEDVMVG